MKCRRCKLEFWDEGRICPLCKTKCSGCDKELTPENQNKRSLINRTNYICKGCVSKRVRESRDKDKQKDYDFRRHYGITKQERDQMAEAQGNACAICKTVTNLHVDHDHETGKVRGLLCSACNKGLGHFNDNLERLIDAYVYLRGED